MWLFLSALRSLRSSVSCDRGRILTALSVILVRVEPRVCAVVCAKCDQELTSNGCIKLHGVQ